MSDPYDPNQPPAEPQPQPASYPPPPPSSSPPPPSPAGYGSVPPPPPPPPPYGAPYYGGPQSYPPAYAMPVSPYAHWGLRVGSYLLDALLLMPFAIVAGIAEGVAEDPNTGDPSGPGVVVAVVAYIALAGFLIWNQIIRQGRTGQSLGKQWVGTRLIREDNGQTLGGWLTFGRQLLHFLDSLACYVGWLWPLWDAKRQTFADKIVKSVVVRQLPAPPF
jgi:uncharacterized RDD family membrane protein YckC